MNLSVKEYPRYAWQLLSDFRINHEQALATLRQQDVRPYLAGIYPLHILDLANGRLRPHYTLLQSAGHKVYGIDLVNRPCTSWTDTTYQMARWIYTRKLRIAPRSANQTLVCGNVGLLPFPDSYFDLITSIAAFEHFLDVPAVVAELHRVTRPGGLVWVCIHLFTSPSGGHNISLTEIPLRTIPRGLDPWDHLRQRQLPFHVPLNQWRRDQYLTAFSQHFEIIKHYCAMREGEALLTPDIEAELSMYTRDELTCGACVIVARKTDQSR